MLPCGLTLTRNSMGGQQPLPHLCPSLTLHKENFITMQKQLTPAALACAAALLTACAAAPVESVATVETAPEPAPQVLTAYAADGLAPALQAFADAQGVALNWTEDAAAASLLALDHQPDTATLDVTGDTLLAAAAARANVTESAASLPAGRSLYGYWVSSSLLNSLLGDGGTEALQNASWEEWSDFVETLQAWLDEPQAVTVTLNGADRTLPETRPDALTATAVFAPPVDRISGYTVAVLAADGQYTADALTGPLNGIYSAVSLEWDAMADSAANGLFRRGKLTDMLAAYGADACQDLVLVPFKCNLDESDLTTEEYDLTGLMDYPILANAGCFAVQDTGDAAALKTAESAVLWLYSSGDGEKALTDTLGVITPWNTASDNTTLGAMQVAQVNTGILPGIDLPTAATAQALTENEQSLQGGTRGKAERTAFTQAALAALGAE